MNLTTLFVLLRRRRLSRTKRERQKSESDTVEIIYVFDVHHCKTASKRQRESETKGEDVQFDVSFHSPAKGAPEPHQKLETENPRQKQLRASHSFDVLRK